MSLQNYIEKPISDLYEELGAFFAFSQKQFDEKKIKGVRYSSLFGGLICPVTHCKELVKRMDEIVENGIKQDLEENGKDSIIERELYNYESFYTYSIEDTVKALEDYGITRAEVKAKFDELKYLQ